MNDTCRTFAREHMERMTLSLFAILVTVVSLLQASGPLAGVTGDTSEPASLWRTAPSPAPDQPPTQRKPPWVLRERDIALDLEVLQILKDASARPHPRVTVEFFDSSRHELDITSTVSRFNDTAVIRGTFKPPSRGDFTLVASGNLLLGSLQVGDRVYKTEHAGNGRLKLLEVDPRKMPPE
jgi:hypothetical protein